MFWGAGRVQWASDVRGDYPARKLQPATCMLSMSRWWRVCMILLANDKGGGGGGGLTRILFLFISFRFHLTTDGSISLGGDFGLNQRDPFDLDMPFAGADPPVRLPSPVPPTCDPTPVGSHSDVAGVAEDLIRQPPQQVAPEVDNHPVTLRDMRDMLTCTMRELQQVVQTTMNQQIETHVRNLLPSIPLPPTLPPCSHPVTQDRSLLLPLSHPSPRQSALPTADYDVPRATSFPQTTLSVRISRLPPKVFMQQPQTPHPRRPQQPRVEGRLGRTQLLLWCYPTISLRSPLIRSLPYM